MSGTGGAAGETRPPATARADGGPPDAGEKPKAKATRGAKPGTEQANTSRASAERGNAGPAGTEQPGTEHAGTEAGPEQGLTPLYKRLPHGPHGLERAEVARHQRTRICGGMVESVYQRGYAATSVAHVIALAGVSRRAFYEQFSNKEDCFLYTYDELDKSSRKRVLRAWLSEQGWANRLYAACRVFLEGIAGDPRSAYLVLVEALSAGPLGNQRMQCTTTSFERVVATGFSRTPDGIALPPLAPRAIVGGMRFVLVRRLREGRQTEIAGLTDEVLDWVSSYRSSAVARLRTLSSAPPRLVVRRARFLTREDRRSTAMDAMVQLSLEDGYLKISDADIARAAAISTEAFHREFANKQECLLAIVDEFAAELHDAILRATRNDEEWPEAVYKGVEALVGYCAAHPGLVRLTFVDLFDAGNGAVERVSGLLDGFIKVMTKRIPAPERAPSVAAEAIVGAIWAILASYAPLDRLKYLPCLIDHISLFVLAPYIGPRAAMETIEAAGAGRRQLARR